MTDEMKHQTPVFTDELRVNLIESLASDSSVISAARVSTQGSLVEDAPEENFGFINFLMKNRHGSPFEHAIFKWRITAPIFVWREFMCHRMASYNEESGRHKQLDAVFYLPIFRPLSQEGKPGHYTMVNGTEEQRTQTLATLMTTCSQAYWGYEKLLDAGVAREVARMSLPLNIMSTAYVTMNSRGLMNFLSLRTKDSNSTYPSFPMWEIEQVARKMELNFEETMPLTHRSFVENGRVQP